MKRDVQFNPNKVVKINQRLICELKERAKKNPDKRCRFCMQHSSNDNLHEMIIVRCKGDYIRPDKHLYTTESHTIIDGAMLVILFKEDGRIDEVFELSKENYFSYRIDENIYHMQIPLTELVVYYEVKLGPFTDESNCFPEWAPEDTDVEGSKIYMEHMVERLQNYQLKNEK